VSAKRIYLQRAEVGPGYMNLMRKFGAQFPGHAATWLAEKALKARKLA
jgi:hypothetical protein